VRTDTFEIRGVTYNPKTTKEHSKKLVQAFYKNYPKLNELNKLFRKKDDGNVTKTTTENTRN
jgi:hypothetical protein